MPYIPFALKYRPQTFEEIVGQEHVSRTLMNAVAQGRVVHAYLFAGPRGTGKTSTARILAKALSCEQGPTPHPCGECSICRAIQDSRCMDVIEMDAASNRGIDDIRALRERVGYSPAEARYKVYILDEAHMLTLPAENALLKTLEEPPPQVFFILATTEPHNVRPTIMSRCQRFDFRAIPVALMVEGLRQIAQAEGVEIDEAALMAIAQAADGAMRNAESIFDQVIAYSDGSIDITTVNAVLGVTERELLSRVADLIAAGDVPAIFAAVDDLVGGGKDLAQFLADLTSYFRDLLRISVGAELAAGLTSAAQMQEQAQALGAERLLQIIRNLAEAQEQLKDTTQQALLVELTLAELAETQSEAAPAPAPVPATAPPAAQPAETQPEAAPVPATVPPAAQPASPPEPAKEEPVPLPPVGEPLTIEAVQARWPQVPEALKRMGHMPVGAIIRDGRPLALDGDTLVVGFDEKFQFHYNKAKEQYREVVEEAIERLVGRRLKMECRLGEAARPAEQIAASDRGPQPTQSPEEPVNSVPSGPAANAQAGLQQAVDQTLQLFEGSREITEE